MFRSTKQQSMLSDTARHTVRYDPQFFLTRSPVLFVSLSHPVVNLPEVFNRLEGRPEAETWLGFDLVVKNHIPFTAPQNLKARVSQVSLPPVGETGVNGFACVSIRQRLIQHC